MSFPPAAATTAARAFIACAAFFAMAVGERKAARRNPARYSAAVSTWGGLLLHQLGLDLAPEGEVQR
eukprot:11713778-Alexandrium_andersonii.AAC.1